jgi:hypothetical protein
MYDETVRYSEALKSTYKSTSYNHPLQLQNINLNIEFYVEVGNNTLQVLYSKV